MGDETLKGSCHCGKVRFELTTSSEGRASRCNCTICRRTAMLGTMVKPAAFRVVEGEDALSSYRWGAGISTRYFCKTCGVHCFGRGHLEQLGGDYVSINLNCVDQDVDESKVVYWDGRHDNWQAGPRPTPWPIVAT